MKTFKQFHEENIGADTNWVDGDVEITLQDVLSMASDPISMNPEDLEHLLIDTKRDPGRVKGADLKYPIVVSVQSGKPTKILDGQHRLVKAIQLTKRSKKQITKRSKKQISIQVRMLNLDTSPAQVQQMFGENFKDGKKKGKSRPGRVKKSGASCSGSVTSLRKKAKAGGERGKMYHWCANMKSGKKKK